MPVPLFRSRDFAPSALLLSTSSRLEKELVQLRAQNKRLHEEVKLLKHKLANWELGARRRARSGKAKPQILRQRSDYAKAMRPRRRRSRYE